MPTTTPSSGSQVPFHTGALLTRQQSPATLVPPQTTGTPTGTRPASPMPPMLPFIPPAASGLAITTVHQPVVMSPIAASSPLNQSYCDFLKHGGNPSTGVVAPIGTTNLSYHLLLKKHKALPRSFPIEMKVSDDLSKLLISSRSFHPLTLAPLALGSDPAVLEVPLFDLIDVCEGVFDASPALLEKHIRKCVGFHPAFTFTLFFSHLEHKNKLAMTYAPSTHHHGTAASGFPIPFYFEATSIETMQQWVRAMLWLKEYTAAQQPDDRRSQLMRLHRNSSLNQTTPSISSSAHTLTNHSDGHTPHLIHSASLNTSVTSVQPHHSAAFSFLDGLKRAFHHASSSPSASPPVPTLSPYQHIYGELSKHQIHPEEHEEESIQTETVDDQQLTTSVTMSPASSSSVASSAPPSLTPLTVASPVFSASPTPSPSIPTLAAHSPSLPRTRSATLTSPHPCSTNGTMKTEMLTSILTNGQSFLRFHSRSLTAGHLPELVVLWCSPDLNTIYCGPDRSKPTHIFSASSITAIDVGVNCLIFGLAKWCFTLVARATTHHSSTVASVGRTVLDTLKFNGRNSFSSTTNASDHAPSPHTLPTASTSTGPTTLLSLHLSTDTNSTLKLWLFALKWLRDMKSNVSGPYNVQRVAWMDTNLNWGGDNLLQMFGITSRESLIKLGGGGMANVYLITHQGTKQQFALKVFHHYPEVIRHEIEIMKELKHKNCVQYFGCIPRGKELYVIMEYVDGGSLSDFLNKKAKEKMHEGHIAFILKQVLLALQYLHSLSILHRDIKCANILLTKKGHVKLTDFGISEHFVNPATLTSPSAAGSGILSPGSYSSSDLSASPPPAILPLMSPPGLAPLVITGSGVNMSPTGSCPPGSSNGSGTGTNNGVGIGGSPLWMSPEALRGLELKPSTDVYSLGITALEIAAGKPPNHECKTLFQVCQNVLSNPSPTLLTHAKDYPHPSQEFQDFVDSCLKKEPTERATVEQLLHHPFILNATVHTAVPTIGPHSHGIVASAKSLIMRGVANLLTSGFSSHHHLEQQQKKATAVDAAHTPDRVSSLVLPSASPLRMSVSANTSPHTSQTNSPQSTMIASHTKPSALFLGSPFNPSNPPSSTRSVGGTPTNSRGGGSGVSVDDSNATRSTTAGLGLVTKKRGSLGSNAAAAISNALMSVRSAGSSPHLSPSSSMHNLHTDTENSLPSISITPSTTTATASATPPPGHGHSASAINLTLDDEPDEGFVSFLQYGTYTRAKFGKFSSATLPNPNKTRPLQVSTGDSTAQLQTPPSIQPIEPNSPPPRIDLDKRPSLTSHGATGSNTLSGKPSSSNNTPPSNSLDRAASNAQPQRTPFLLKKQSGERKLVISSHSPTNASASNKPSSTHHHSSHHKTKIPTQDPNIQLQPPSLIFQSSNTEMKQSVINHSQSVLASPPPPVKAKLVRQTHVRQFSKLPKLLPPLTLKRTASMSTVAAFELASHAEGDDLPTASPDSTDLSGEQFQIFSPKNRSTSSESGPSVLPPSNLSRYHSTPPAPPAANRRAASIIYEGDEEATATPSHSSLSISIEPPNADSLSRGPSGSPDSTTQYPPPLPALFQHRSDSMIDDGPMRQVSESIIRQDSNGSNLGEISRQQSFDASPTDLSMSRQQTSELVIDGMKSLTSSNSTSRQQSQADTSKSGRLSRHQSSNDIPSATDESAPLSMDLLQRDRSYSHSYVAGPPKFLKPLALTAKERIEQQDEDGDQKCDDENENPLDRANSLDESEITNALKKIKSNEDGDVEIEPFRSDVSKRFGLTLPRSIASSEGSPIDDSSSDPFATERQLLRKSSLTQGDGGSSVGDMNASYVISSHGTLIAGNFAISAQGLHASPNQNVLSRRSTIVEGTQPQVKKRSSLSKRISLAETLPEGSESMYGGGEEADDGTNDNDESDMVDDDSSASPSRADHALSKSDLFTLGVIGKGQNGPVLKAIHLPSLTRVALKSIYAHDRGTRHQLLHELTAYLHFDSPYLVSFLGAYYEDSIICLATEYMDQGSLQHFINRNGPLQMRPRVFKQIAYQCIEGLKHMHDHHSLHRDIKPDNILLDHEARIKIADFGLLKDLGSTFAMSNTFLGTMSYLSPERIMSNDYSYPSDIWSMGLTFIYALTGRIPKQSSDYFTMMDIITKHPPQPLTKDEHGLTEDLCDFVNGMVRLDPNERYTADQLLSHPFLLGTKSPTKSKLLQNPDIAIPQTQLPTDPDHDVWSVGDANLADLDLIFEFMISKHLLPELKKQHTIMNTPSPTTHHPPSVSPIHLPQTSDIDVDSISTTPIVSSTDGTYTTSLIALTPSTTNTPPFRLPLHIGGSLSSSTTTDEEESVIQTFPVILSAPIVQQDDVPVSPSSTSDSLTNGHEFLGRPSQPIRSSSQSSDVSASSEMMDSFISDPCITRPSTSTMSSVPSDGHDTTNSHAPESQPPPPLPPIEDSPAHHDSEVTGTNDITICTNTTSNATETVACNILTPPHHHTTISNCSVTSLPPPPLPPQLDEDGLSDDDSDVNEASSPPRLVLPTLPTDSSMIVSSSEEDVLPPKFVSRLSLKISSTESVEDSSEETIPIIPMAAEEEENVDATYSTNGPRLSLATFMPEISVEEEGDTIITFDATDSSINSSILSGSSTSPSTASSSSSTTAVIELLPLDSARCDCLARQFGCTPEVIQEKWNAKQREMLKRNGIQM